KLPEQCCGQTAGLGAEHEHIVRLESRYSEALGAARAERKHAVSSQCSHACFPVFVHVDICVFAVVETGPAQIAIVQAKPERTHEMQLCPRVCAKADDIASIRRYLWLVEHHMKHLPAPACW